MVKNWIWAAEPLFHEIDLFAWTIPEYWPRAGRSQDADWLLIRTSSSAEELDSQRDHYTSLELKDSCRVILVNLLWIADNIDTEQFICRQKEKYHWLDRELIYLHTNRAVDKGFYDLLWNRHKFYFTAYRSDVQTAWTEWQDQTMFELAEIPDEKTAHRVYLSPNRIYPEHISSTPRLKFRQQLAQHLDHEGNYVSKLGRYLPAQQHSDRLWDRVVKNQTSIWQPIHNDIYLDSYCSVYVESLVDNGHTRSITEKTLDPLIKGHFILPFAYRGFRQDVKDMGFILPEELDLSYLDLADQDQRWLSFLREVDKNQQRDWREFYKRYRSILVHNRSVFWQKPYDRLRLELA